MNLSLVKTLSVVMFMLSGVFVSDGQVRHIIVELHSIEGYGLHEDFARKAALALREVFNTDEFRKIVLDTTFIKTAGLTNAELYDRIMTAHEKQGPGGKDGVVDLRVRTLRVDADERHWKDNCTRTSLGIDGTGDGVTAVCPNRLHEWATANELGELAGHFAHEYPWLRPLSPFARTNLARKDICLRYRKYRRRNGQSESELNWVKNISFSTINWSLTS